MAIQEFKRTCNACGKVWHSLVSREEQLKKNAEANAWQICAGCCNPGTASQGIGTGQIIENEQTRLKQCPECGSASYTEEIVTYDEPDAG